ncbi:hypothetical protein [Dickeya zeae]|uniref:hypothetical protein n=1 Tax=Dickeya zeae TaxID=204042 RepID=UPI000372FE9E|nr:hypothetical protein [Dickeya zeae]UJR53255.1 hypothetical protein J417_03835 [Dickeya zeae MS1]
MKLPAISSPDICYDSLKGDEIGYGGSRIVYDIAGYPDWVLKECMVSENTPNKYEWIVYSTAVEKKYNMLLSTLAEIHSISESGKYLVMEKLTTHTISNGDSCNVMEELTDLKKSNFGRGKNGDIKSLDYATIKLDFNPKEISGRVVLYTFPSDENVTQMQSWKDLLD